MTQQYMTVWRKVHPDNVLEWDQHFSDHIDDARQVVANLKKRGVKQFSTYPIGERVADLSSEY